MDETKIGLDGQHRVCAFGAHPDDIELSCGGTLLGAAAAGAEIGVVDITRGELGTRGTAEIRAQEATAAAKVLNLAYRDQLEIPDGSVLNTPENRLIVIRAIRLRKPTILLCNAIRDRHPDHGNAAELVEQAAFLAGLRNIHTEDEHGPQEPWRPRIVLHYIQDRAIEPDIAVNITDFFDRKIEAVRCYGSQFYQEGSGGPVTYISTPDFMDGQRYKAAEMGHRIGVQYAEGFTSSKKLGVKTLLDII